MYPEWLSDGRDASSLIEQSETERIADKALERLPAGTRRLLQLRATGLSLEEPNEDSEIGRENCLFGKEDVIAGKQE